MPIFESKSYIFGICFCYFMSYPWFSRSTSQPPEFCCIFSLCFSSRFLELASGFGTFLYSDLSPWGLSKQVKQQHMTLHILFMKPESSFVRLLVFGNGWSCLNPFSSERLIVDEMSSMFFSLPSLLRAWYVRSSDWHEGSCSIKSGFLLPF